MARKSKYEKYINKNSLDCNTYYTTILYKGKQKMCMYNVIQLNCIHKVMKDQHSHIWSIWQGGRLNGSVVPLNKWHFPTRLCPSSISLHPQPFFYVPATFKARPFFYRRNTVALPSADPHRSVSSAALSWQQILAGLTVLADIEEATPESTLPALSRLLSPNTHFRLKTGFMGRHSL